MVVAFWVSDNNQISKQYSNSITVIKENMKNNKLDTLITKQYLDLCVHSQGDAAWWTANVGKWLHINQKYKSYKECIVIFSESMSVQLLH